jgi:hypothetical protein
MFSLADTFHLSRNWHVEETGSFSTVRGAVEIHRPRPR